MRKSNLSIAVTILQRTDDGKELTRDKQNLVNAAISGYLEEGNQELIDLLESLKYKRERDEYAQN